MTLKRRSAGAFVNVASVKRRSGGAWVAVQTIKRRSGGAWVTVYSALNITKSGDIDQNVFVAEPAPTTRSMSGSMSVTVTGSTSFTLAWTKLSGGSVGINNATIANPTFSATVPKNTTVSATYRCTVTDTPSGLTDSVDVFVSFQYTTDL
jgi:hypothetical protein